MKRNWALCIEKLRDEDYRCRVCGSPWRIQAAHIIPRSLGGGMKKESVLPLCEEHHKKYDQHRLNLGDYLTIDEWGEAVRVYEARGEPGTAAEARINPLAPEDVIGGPGWPE